MALRLPLDSVGPVVAMSARSSTPPRIYSVEFTDSRGRFVSLQVGQVDASRIWKRDLQYVNLHNRFLAIRRWNPNARLVHIKMGRGEGGGPIMRRLNTCPNQECGHYSWAHEEGGCRAPGCKCKATGLALGLAAADAAHNAELIQTGTGRNCHGWRSPSPTPTADRRSGPQPYEAIPAGSPAPPVWP
jgi:hypothetical protein